MMNSKIKDKKDVFLLSIFKGTGKFGIFLEIVLILSICFEVGKLWLVVETLFLGVVFLTNNIIYYGAVNHLRILEKAAEKDTEIIKAFSMMLHNVREEREKGKFIILNKYPEHSVTVYIVENIISMCGVVGNFVGEEIKKQTLN